MKRMRGLRFEVTRRVAYDTPFVGEFIKTNLAPRAAVRRVGTE